MNRICIVSGCSRGIGRCIATQLAKSGYSLGLLSRNISEIETLRDEISANGKKHIALKCDICDENNIKESILCVSNELGAPTSLVNVAGINKDGLLVGYNTSDLNSLIQTNIIGTIMMTRAVLPYMIKSKCGSIVCVGSIVGEQGRAGQSVYAATKSSLIGFSKSLAKEMGRSSIRVNVVQPGFIDTSMTKSINGELLSHIALGRMGTCNEVADAVEFLLSNKASYITGSVLKVDGGIVL